MLDEQHKNYFSENPQGNHDRMSLETKLMFDKLNETLELKFSHIIEKLEDMEKDISATLDQTKRTNGRVTKLEGWKNKFAGALIITEAILLPIAVWALIQILEKSI